MDIVLIFIYSLFSKYKFSYFNIVLIGLLIGILVSFISLRLNNYGLNNYFAIVSYFVINTIFISYSLSFKEEKKIVFD